LPAVRVTGWLVRAWRELLHGRRGPPADERKAFQLGQQELSLLSDHVQDVKKPRRDVQSRRSSALRGDALLRPQLARRTELRHQAASRQGQRERTTHAVDHP
jgi:hypothetical protein